MSPNPATPDVINIDEREAERRTGISGKTLARLAAAGQPVGRLKIGRRRLYHVVTLSTWIESQIKAGRPDGA